MRTDLRSYAERIGFTGELRPSAECLRELHLAHATHVPFENIDVLLGQPIRLDIESLWKKLVECRRGGYCFEQNTLFAAVLEEIGFPVTRLAARVRLGATAAITSRAHMLLAVQADGRRWLADVGFGGDALLHPVPWLPGETAEQFGWKYRMMVEAPGYLLQTWRAEGWVDLYSFTMEEQYPVDYEVANYWTSTHPNSFFRKKLLVHMPGPDMWVTLVNRRLIERRPEGSSEALLPDDAAILETLAERFGLQFPEGTQFPYEEEAISTGN
jgi:N-hydroxyarylamine O-acetyltransferase